MPFARNPAKVDTLSPVDGTMKRKPYTVTIQRLVVKEYRVAAHDPQEAVGIAVFRSVDEEGDVLDVAVGEEEAEAERPPCP
jgi:hypothetical protein